MEAKAIVLTIFSEIDSMGDAIILHIRRAIELVSDIPGGRQDTGSDVTRGHDNNLCKSFQTLHACDRLGASDRKW